MKSSSANNANPEPLVRRRESHPVIRGIAACAASLFIALSPMLERHAKAESQPATQQKHADYMVSGTGLRISDGKDSPWVYAISRQSSLAPSIKLAGPAKLSVRYYPAVSLKRFEGGDSEIPWPVNYSLAKEDGKPEELTHEGKTGASNFRSAEIDQTALAIGTPISITVTIPAGRHTFSLLSPNGFMEVVSVRQVEKKAPQTQPAKKAAPVVKAPPKAVQKPAAPIERNALPRFAFEAERLNLDHIGSTGSSGDLNLALAAGNFPLGRRIAASAGVMFSSFGFTLETPEALTDLRSFSADAAAGLVLSMGRHRVLAGGFGGYRAMLRNINLRKYASSDEERSHQLEFGGHAGYGYGRLFEIAVSGSNNPFCPLSAKIHGTLPFGWVRDAKIWADADVLWLHAPKPLAEQGLMGGIRLNENNVYARLTAGVPIWRVGGFVPSALVAGTLNASGEGFHHADLLLGAALSFETKRFLIQGGGGASALTGAPFFLLKAIYK